MPVTAALLQQTLDRELLEVVDESLSPELQYALLNLGNNVLSKCIDVEDATAERLTVEGFKLSNDLCGRWELKCETERDKLLISYFRELSYREDITFDDVGYSSMFVRGAFGPGKSRGVPATDFFSKAFNGPLTTSHDWLYSKYLSFVQNFPEWERAEMARFSSYGVSVVASSSLTTVPKKRTIRRTICTEPSLDMFFQLGLGTRIAERLKQLSVDLSTQPAKNAHLARLGSIDGLTATIDLKSASDRISRKMALEFFPRLASLITTVSSSSCQYKKEVIPLNMLSTMGNGATFPFQTLLFLTVVRATLWLRRQTLHLDTKTYGVFGDDIVCPTDCYDDVCRLCHLLGFEVNAHKSFHTGSFRESCGKDFLSGHNVRSVYIKSLASPHDRYAAANRLVAWCVRMGVLLPRTIRLLLDGLPARHVPLWCDVHSGFRVPSWLRTSTAVHHLRWTKQKASYTLPMEGDMGNYVAFLGGYLRTTESQASKAGGIGSARDGEIARRPRKASWYLRRYSTPHALWDGWADKGDGFVYPSQSDRLDAFLYRIVTRDLTGRS